MNDQTSPRTVLARLLACCPFGSEMGLVTMLCSKGGEERNYPSYRNELPDVGIMKLAFIHIPNIEMSTDNSVHPDIP